MKDYCPNCEEDTEQNIVPDSIFGLGIRCEECRMIWEMEIKIIPISKPLSIWLTPEELYNWMNRKED